MEREIGIRTALLAALGILVGLPVAVLALAVATISVFDRTNGTLVSSGEEREYLLHVPHSYDPSQPTALVISLHGGATWPAQQMNLSGWNRLADQHGFIVVYPSGTPQIAIDATAQTWAFFVEHPLLRARTAAASR